MSPRGSPNDARVMSDRARAHHRGVVYCVWTVLEGDPPTVVIAMVALLAGVPLYPCFIRSLEAAPARKRSGVGSVDPARQPGTGEPVVSGSSSTAEPLHA